MRRVAGLTSLCIALGACGEVAGGDTPLASGGAGSDASAVGGSSSAGQETRGGSAATLGGSAATLGGSAATLGGSSGSANQQGGARIVFGGAAGMPAMVPPRECRNAPPEPGDGGYVQCGTGEYQRPRVGVCSSKLPRPERNESRLDTECWFDEECGARAHGFCAWGSCRYGCVSDDECETGRICFCGDPVGYCVPALCRSSADCNDGYPCYSVTPSQGFACQRSDGGCETSGHCSAGWACQYGTGSQFEPGNGCWPPPG